MKLPTNVDQVSSNGSSMFLVPILIILIQLKFFFLYSLKLDQFINKIICKDEELELRCKQKEDRLVIFSAQFLMASTSSSKHCQHSNQLNNSMELIQNCPELSVTENVMKICHGRSNCTIKSNLNQLLAINPMELNKSELLFHQCPLMNEQYLKIVYTCLHKKMLNNRIILLKYGLNELDGKTLTNENGNTTMDFNRMAANNFTTIKSTLIETTTTTESIITSTVAANGINGLKLSFDKMDINKDNEHDHNHNHNNNINDINDDNFNDNHFDDKLEHRKISKTYNERNSRQNKTNINPNIDLMMNLSSASTILNQLTKDEDRTVNDIHLQPTWRSSKPATMIDKSGAGEQQQASINCTDLSSEMHVVGFISDWISAIGFIQSNYHYSIE